VARLFGTDGVRGLANRDITAELALGLSVSAAHVLGDAARAQHRPFAVVGRDPRASGEFLSAAVSAGLASAGVDVVDVGVLPTPAVAYLTGLRDADFGVMLSASHNPMPDNGIKFFARGGHKLDDALEDQIEARLHAEWSRPTGADVGRVRDDSVGADDDYVAHLLGALPHRLDGLRIVIDCANGAASEVGPRALREAGADVVVIGASPDGININDGYGSTHLGNLRLAVAQHGAHAGIAVDGDADRCLAVDADGEIVDGDQIMAVLALAMREQGELAGDTLVATVMSNLGLLQAMRREGVLVEQTDVGDRYVLERMRSGGFTLGGEQSGHVILASHGTTGDGLLTGLRLLSRMAQTGRSLSDLASVMERLPQVLVNVKGVDKRRAHDDDGVLAAVGAAQEQLADDGRVLLRPSGTEPLVRVMVEAHEVDVAQAVADRLASVVKERLAL
jgi:phosphoglucosamine mutase